MRISALAERTGVPVATLKYYLREGLLPAGTATARTQALYDDSHVERVRLIRALTESAGLSLAEVRTVLAALDNPPASRHDLLGAAQDVMLAREALRAPADESDDEWSDRARALAERCGGSHHLVPRLATQLRAASAAGVALDDATVDAYAEAATRIADADLASVPDDPAAALQQVVVGTLLTDPVLLTLRRIADEGASQRRSRAPREAHTVVTDWALQAPHPPHS